MEKKNAFKLFILFIVLTEFIFIISLISAQYCSEDNLVSNVPCTINTLPLNCSGDVFIQSTTNPNIRSSVSMALMNSSCTTNCVYNFTFNYNIPAKYKLSLCDGFSYGYIEVSNAPTLSPQNQVTYIQTNYQEILSVPTYPYVELNVTYPIVFEILKNNTLTNIGNVNITINNTDYPMNYANSEYNLNVTFTNVGDYDFVIHPSNQTYQNLTGTFLVRLPFYVTFCGFQQNSWLMSKLFGDSTKPYKNNYAYLSAEFTGNKKYSSAIEPFADTFETTLQKTDLFHAPYNNGCGVLKLYENSSYAIRIFDGDVTFDGDYGRPNITKSYGTNIYVGQFTLNPTTNYFSVLFSNKDIKPYFWLFNILFISAIIFFVVASIIIFFMFPQVPFLSIGFFIITIVGSLIIRVVIYFYIG